MGNEPLTEAIGSTQESPLADPSPTEAGLNVPFPQTPQAWSEEALAEEWAPVRRARARWAVGVLPALVAGGILAYALTSHRPPAPMPKAPPPTATITTPALPPTPPKPAPHACPSCSDLDDLFITATINHNAPQTNTTEAIYNAHKVCELLTHGQSRAQIEIPLREAVSGWSDEQAAIFVGLAAEYYCPQFA